MSEDIRKTVNFLRAHVNHFSFVVGLLTGGAVGLNVILRVEVHEDRKVVNPKMGSPLELAPCHNVLEGALCQCTDLLTFIAGTYDSKSLAKSKFSNSPTEFMLETWQANEDDAHEWQMKKKTTYQDVKWLDAAHNGDGGDRMCAGIATFTCSCKEEFDIENGEIVNVPKGKRYPFFELRSILQQKMAGPKHPASYMG